MKEQEYWNTRQTNSETLKAYRRKSVRALVVASIILIITAVLSEIVSIWFLPFVIFTIPKYYSAIVCVRKFEKLEKADKNFADMNWKTWEV